MLIDIRKEIRSDFSMPRKERMEYGGGVYHVMDRGNRLEAIYEDDRE